MKTTGSNIALNSPHLFHIPVMGTGFSIDTPIRVAKYGISSVISLVDDILIEQMRKHHCGRLGLKYVEIPPRAEDSRATRITAYLELLSELIATQIREMKASPFEPKSSITTYFEMLPDSPLKKSYTDMLSESDPVEKAGMQDALRLQVVPGTIDVNIMTKLDRDRYMKGKILPPECSDAMAALRGYAKSSLRSSIIFSAGINQRLFSYLAEFDDFFPDAKGDLRKKIVLKVSDFRSAMIQGKFLARRGLWVSEYRIESGLNCGGHAFATQGHLMGPILEEFRNKKAELIDQLHQSYSKTLVRMERAVSEEPHQVRITVQGGIGTADEQRFLFKHYDVDGTGWGTPFLLVPEVINVDDDHIKKLSAAGDKDVCLSDHSPLGVPFWSLRTSASEEVRRKRIATDKPGSPCPKGFLVSNTEFTKVPICHASRAYQKKKLVLIEKGEDHLSRLEGAKERVTAKSCICHDLAGGATLKYGIDEKAHTAVCCGPNIVNFSKVATLEEMVSHIYGRLSLFTDADRPHMFIKELSIYIEYFRQEIQKTSDGLLNKTTKFFLVFKDNLNVAIEHYQGIAKQLRSEQKEKFLRDLDALCEEIEKVFPESTTVISPGVAS